MNKEAPTKSPYDRSLDDANFAAAGKADITNSTGGFYRGRNSDNSTRADSAKNLNDLENSAINSSNLNSEKSASAAEKATDFVSNVAGKAAPAPAKAALKAKGRLKKYGPIGMFIGVILTVAAFFFTSQGLFGVGFVDRFINEFNTWGTASQTRSHSVIRHLIKQGNIPKGVKSELNKQGIKVSSKNGVLYLHFKDNNGNKVRVAATADGAKESKIGRNAITLDDAIAKYPEFSTKMIAGTERFGGQSSGWYNKYAQEFLKFYSLDGSRDRFHNYDATEVAEGEEAESKVQETIAEGREKMTSTGEHVKKVEGEDSDGNSQSRPESDGTTSIDTSNEDKLRNDLKNIAASSGSKLSSAGSAIANLASGGACINYYIQAGIKAVRNGIIKQESLLLFSTIAEIIQKSQTGAGKNSPITTIMNMLTKPGADGKAAISAPGLAVLFSGGKGDQYNNNQVVKDTSLEGLSSQGGGTVNDYKTCNASRLAASGFNIADTLTDYAPGIGWAKRGLKILFGVVVTQVANFVIEGVVQAQIDSAVKTMMIDVSGDDFYTEYSGQFAYIGGQTELSGRARYSGQVAFTQDTLGAARRAHEEVLAQQAEYERAIFSPFDTRSQYTFLGSLTRSIASFSATSSLGGVISQMGSTVTNSLTQILPHASANSLTSLDQTVGFCPAAASAGAYDDNDTTGAVANMNCIPFIGDVSNTSDRTKDISLEDLFNTLCSIESDKGGQLDECSQSDVDIYKPLNTKNGSKLAKFAAFWNKSETDLGDVNSNTAAALGNGAANTIAAIGIDGLSDIADAIAAFTDNNPENICWSTGGVGVYGSPCQQTYLPEVDYFQAYYGWEEWKQNAGVSSSSDFVAIDDLDSDDDDDETGYEVTTDPVQDYLDSKIIAYNPDEDLSDVVVINEYTGEPYDMSYEAVLARRAGLSKDTIIALLDQIDYYIELANYDPTDLGPVNDTKESAPALAGAPEEEPQSVENYGYLGVIVDSWPIARVRHGVATA